ncbi:MAG: hypothetical protein JWN23_994 [Rhodocyclales bacterium]|nr:hypothetical protein [Rhodocyclales bacterium]
MSAISVVPSTIEGIKRLAKTLSKEQSITHTQGLDEAARAGGYANFRHARNMLPASSDPRPREIFVSAYWYDYAGAGEGRETLRVGLKHELAALISPRQFANTRYLRGFKTDASDHIVYRIVMKNQEAARKAVCAATRALQFMDATKLKPGSGHIGRYLKNWHRDPLKGCDHGSMWTNKDGTSWVLVDEPYSSVGSFANIRNEWAQRHDLTIAQSTWAGMYFPSGGACLFLIGSDAPLVLKAAAAANRLPAPFSSDSWSGHSAPFRPLFQSPARATSASKPRAPCDPALVRPSQKTLPCETTFGGRNRRPRGVMSMEDHKTAANILRAALAAAARRAGVCGRLEAVRGELDRWVAREHVESHSRFPEMYVLYYEGSEDVSDASFIPQLQKDQLLSNLGHLSAVLKSAYPDSAPLRDILHRLEGARKSLVLWKSLECVRADRRAKGRQM